MRDLVRARIALARAGSTMEEIERTLWLAKSADHALSGRAVLVGGAAVNLYTGSYRPTDIDMCARLDDDDRRALREIGFEHLQGDHFGFTFDDAERWLLEFPEAMVDGDVRGVRLNADETLQVISLESLVVDRVRQATDDARVTFDEALRLAVAVYEEADWLRIESQIREDALRRPSKQLSEKYEQVMAAVREVIDPLEM